MSERIDNEELMSRLAQLNSSQKRLLLERLRARDISIPSRGGKLVAFYQSEEELISDDLRAMCLARLPSHMVPQRFIHEHNIALTPTGKLDRQAMRARLWSSAPSYTDTSHQQLTQARDETEKVLSEIWCDVLGVDEISVFDNFFEIGGDSLQVIRILSRASKAGLSIKPDAIFTYPTIAELAQQVNEVSAPTRKAVEPFGDFPLLPIQHWFFDSVTSNENHWNQSYLFALKRSVTTEKLRTILSKVMAQHVGLNSVFQRTDGQWKGRINQSMESSIREYSLTSLSVDEYFPAMQEVADEENQSFELASGSLFKAINFTHNQESGYLLLCAHHLVVDAVSWQIVIRDIDVALTEAGGDTGDSGDASRDQSASLREWAIALEKFTTSDDLLTSSEYWNQQARIAASEPSGLDVDSPEDGRRGIEGNCRWLSRQLSASHTTQLRSIKPKELRATVQEMLLSALVRVIQERWGLNQVTLDLEGHGREAIIDNLDVSQTVGWCTSVFPVTFKEPSKDAWTSAREALRGVKEQFRAVPHNGLSHGLLKYVSNERTTNTSLQEAPRSRILFNYLGVEDQANSGLNELELVESRFGTLRRHETPRAYVLELNAVIRNDQLTIDWAWSPEIHTEGEVAMLADEFVKAIENIIDGNDQTSESSVSPSDFPMAGLDQASLDNLSSQLDELDDD